MGSTTFKLLFRYLSFFFLYDMFLAVSFPGYQGYNFHTSYISIHVYSVNCACHLYWVLKNIFKHF